MILGFEKKGQGKRGMKLSENLSHHEFMCRCKYEDCTYTLVNSVLLQSFEKLRIDVQQPLYVRSGYRCQKHNTDVGGVEKSRHMRGDAIDLEVPTTMHINRFVFLCAQYFNVVIPYEEKGFVHCHNEPSLQ